MAYDLVIANGTVATAADVFEADIGISDGRVVQIGGDMGGATRVIDATGRYVLPGGIDSHVHIAQPSGPGIVMADDFDSATRSAAFGGNTTVMPFCLQERGQSLATAFRDYREKATGSHVDFGFHMIVTDPTPQVLGQELPALIEEGQRSVKVFMTYEAMRMDDAGILATMDVARRHGAKVMVHCENEDVIAFLAARAAEAGDVAPRAHATTRPVAAEREATHRALTLAEVVDVPIVIVHVSNGAAIDEIARARSRGIDITAETCPQYLVLEADDLARDNWEGAKFVCSPPPRDTTEQKNCWRGLETGLFDLFSSDHCPFRYEDDQGKRNPAGLRSFRHIPNGIPGVETRLPILFSEGVMKGRIDLTRFVALTSTNHARAYDMYPRKGTIAVGADADITIWDPQVRKSIRHADLHDAADYSPYEGFEVQGWPETVILRGKPVVEDGKLTAPGAGREVPRAAT
ncbi:dihydropyrimidinase [Histidinibacterium aquaticum]|uniref:D-hydantoinase n=1 Tax=Histidinibacterium aquaticum TaxID=2613962 RepID=A0A5J5GKX7_9RHOB|nr:dihydropyrimidinase [Histidinibacterium aquaticum]KAA9008790.1 dihydropyrimidinase [Histidinibacterium aquaticum]